MGLVSTQMLRVCLDHTHQQLLLGASNFRLHLGPILKEAVGAAGAPRRVSLVIADAQLQNALVLRETRREDVELLHDIGES